MKLNYECYSSAMYVVTELDQKIKKIRRVMRYMRPTHWTARLYLHQKALLRELCESKYFFKREANKYLQKMTTEGLQEMGINAKIRNGKFYI